MPSARKLEDTLRAPSPKGGQHRRIKLPNDWKGIQFVIGRMAQNIRDQYRQKYIIDAARQIAARWCRFVEDQMAQRGEHVSTFGSQVIQLEGLYIWCKHHAHYVNDPHNMEVTQTPERLLRQTELSSEFIEMLMEPFYREMEERDETFKKGDYKSPPLMIGDCDELDQLCLTMAASLGMRPIKLRFGATGDEIHHVWGNVTADAEEFEIDLTEPTYELGQVGDYTYTEEYTVIE